jgi:hypothetical protein
MWVLIIILTSGYGDATTSVPNFSTETACIKAGTDVIKNTNAYWHRVHFTCIRRD